MRQFMMKNADGQTFDLMRKDAFLSEPAGLGFGQDVELTQAGTGWVLTKSSYTRPEPSGQMVFAGYDQYEEFLKFLGAGSTELWYKPLSGFACPVPSRWTRARSAPTGGCAAVSPSRALAPGPSRQCLCRPGWKPTVSATRAAILSVTARAAPA